MRLKLMGAPEALHRGDADANGLRRRSALPVGDFDGGSMVSATMRAAMAASRFGTREGRVLSRGNPSKPLAAKRSCQRQTRS
jgi:hypothetical protein